MWNGKQLTGLPKTSTVVGNDCKPKQAEADDGHSGRALLVVNVVDFHHACSPSVGETASQGSAVRPF